MIEPFLAKAIAFAQNSTNPAVTSPQAGGIYPFLIFIAIIVAVRLYRGINGRVYSRARVLRLPAIYVVLTVFSLVALSYLNSDVLLTLAFIPAGALLGYRFGTNVKFMVRNNVLYYARSPFMLILWFASFIARFLLEYLYPTNVTVMLVVDSALTITTGIFIGEAMNVIKKRKEYGNPPMNSDRETDNFRINL